MISLFLRWMNPTATGSRQSHRRLGKYVESIRNAGRPEGQPSMSQATLPLAEKGNLAGR